MRALEQRDVRVLLRFVVMASFPAGSSVPAGAADTAHVRRWLDEWSDELGVCIEDDHGEIAGAAWARQVVPVHVRHPVSGRPLPEVILAVSRDRRRGGLGLALIEGLLEQARQTGCDALAAKVRESNSGALRIAERVGFTRHAALGDGRIAMVWCASSRQA